MTELHKTAPTVHPPLARRRGRRKRPVPHVNHERWLVSYADFVTLLFAFFTTLYAISKVDADKLSTMVGSMHQAFEPSRAARSREAIRFERQQNDPNARPIDPSDDEVRRALQQTLGEEVKAGQVALDVDSRGVVISMLESGSFPVGSTDLTPEARAVLSTIATTIAGLNGPVRVEGHTDDVPIHTAKFASNWELSTARATSVVQYLIDSAGLPASRLSASGYGEFHPKVPNDSPDNRTRNRRVDVVVLNSGTRTSEEPPVRPSSPQPEKPSDPRPR